MKRVPDKLKVILKKERTLTRTVMGQEQTVQVRPAFFVPDDSPEMLETAIAWARGYSKRGYVKSKKEGGPHFGEEPEIREVPNDTFHALTLWDLVHRSQGGDLAFRVLTREGWLVDLREDEFMQTILSSGMRGGWLEGDFRWVRSGTSQMRIAIVGSDLYQQCLEDDKLKARKPILKEGLEVGGVYRGNFTHDQVYLGRVRYEGKVFQAWIALYVDEYHMKRAGLPIDDRQAMFDYRWRCSPNVQIVKEKKVLQKVANVHATEIRISRVKGWSGGFIDREKIEGIDLPVVGEK